VNVAVPASLPTAQNVLRRIPGFDHDTDVRIDLLHGGNHSSFLVETGTEKYVLRLGGAAAALAPAPDLDHEHAVLSLLAAQDLAPRPVYVDRARGVLLTGFLDGRVLSREDLQRPAYLAPLAALLARVHRHAWDKNPADPVTATRRYLGIVERSTRFTPAAAAIRHRLGSASAFFVPTESPVLCHNDLLSGNIHTGTKLRLLDWEYSGGGDPWFDIASLICYHDIGAEARHALVDAYQRHSGSFIPANRLDGLCALVDCQTLAWALARRAGGIRLQDDATLARSAAARLGLTATVWE